MNSKVKVLSLLVLLAQAYVTPAFASIELVFPWYFPGTCGSCKYSQHGLDWLRWGSTVYAEVSWEPSNTIGFGLMCGQTHEYYKGSDGWTYQEMEVPWTDPDVNYWYIYVYNYGGSTIDYEIIVWNIDYA